MRPRFFKSPADFRSWLSENHDKQSELLVGFYKKGASKKGISWSEAVDQALCFGWIDGVRKSIDDDRYTIRFTPRKPGSIWSTVNIGKVEDLKKKGLMEPPGLAAFAARTEKKSKIYAYEQREPSFDTSQARRFRANRKAWEFFQQQAPWYRRNATWWVISAKREETRERRLTQLIEDSSSGRRLKQYSRYDSA